MLNLYNRRKKKKIKSTRKEEELLYLPLYGGYNLAKPLDKKHSFISLVQSRSRRCWAVADILILQIISLAIQSLHPVKYVVPEYARKENKRKNQTLTPEHHARNEERQTQTQCIEKKRRAKLKLFFGKKVEDLRIKK